MALSDEFDFGIGNSEAAGLTLTESVSMTTRMDKAEAYDNNGNLCAFRYYNPHGEFTATGYGLASVPVMAAVTDALTGLNNDTHIDGTTDSDVFITSVAEENASEDYRKFTISGVFYKNIKTS